MRSFPTLIIAMALLLGACTGATGVGGDVWSRSTTTTDVDTVSDTSPRERRTGRINAATASLRLGESCDSFTAWLHDEVVERTGIYGFEDQAMAFGMGATVDQVEMFASDGDDSAGAMDMAGAPPAAPPAAGVDEFSTTNVQEAGVDEADIVKTDGTFIYAVANGTLQVVDANPTDPVVVDRLEIINEYEPAELLLGDDRLYLIHSGNGPDRWLDSTALGGLPVEPDMVGWAGATVIQEILVSPAGELTEGDRLSVEGWYVTARQIGTSVRLVVNTQPHMWLDFVHPTFGRSDSEATEHNQGLVRETTASDWLPRFELLAAGGTAESGTLTGCDRVAIPETFSGVSTTSVLTFDMDGTLGTGNPVTVFGSGDTVYASATSLYTSGYAVPENEMDEWSTQIHRFDISDPTTTTYLASGLVPGRLMNQWAMSEHDGHLRVATTEDNWMVDAVSTNSVVVLRTEGDDLVQTGIVEGLGPDEQVYGVRFMGTTGYVVTFRLTDPLYVLDLSDPTDPQVLGELKITGYSSYLHPVGDGLMVGVGSEATTDGMTVGAKISLFDVSDPTQPEEVDRLIFPDWWSQAESDHRSFLYWEPANLAVVPMSGGFSFDGEGALAFSVEQGRLVEQARLDGATMRSLVIGDTLWTVGWSSLRSFDLASLSPLAEVSLNN